MGPGATPVPQALYSTETAPQYADLTASGPGLQDPLFFGCPLFQLADLLAAICRHVLVGDVHRHGFLAVSPKLGAAFRGPAHGCETVLGLRGGGHQNATPSCLRAS